ncbi:HD domain-containing protein [Pedobacter sp. SYP-B3415]|uniref:HD domain-containing protein n=1 Tax=Pedobacter sp. SYP-B3415 TaxID=2496641 RepID=UPI00101CFA84|nr:HD domain-containing protein [Pedobacter sp. SYP-B3415]
MKQWIEDTVAHVRAVLKDAEAGHDWFHIERVWKTAMAISREEGADELVVTFAALLHDIADPKFNGGNEELGPQMATDFLKQLGVPAETIRHVVNIIRHMSFKNSFDQTTFSSPEMQIVQDADRLDAIGAIGIARAFTYGGFKNRVIYDPAVPLTEVHTKESYKATTAPTINHFYEKLLLLKDRMNTPTGRKMAGQRHEFMLNYLEQFYSEWEGLS